MKWSHLKLFKHFRYILIYYPRFGERWRISASWIAGEPSRGGIPGSASRGIFGSGYSTALTWLKRARTYMSDLSDIGRRDSY